MSAALELIAPAGAIAGSGRCGTRTMTPSSRVYAVAWSSSASISSTDRFVRRIPSGSSSLPRTKSSHGTPVRASTT